MTKRLKTLIGTKPGAQEAEGDIQQLTLTPENNFQGLGEKCKIATE